MKKILFLLIAFMTVVTVSAQIPYFAGTTGDNNLYGYTSVKFKPGTDNNLETYTTLQYGIGNQFAVGMDLYTGGNSSYIGYTIRGNFYKSNYFNIGAQFTPSFDLGNSHKFSYATTGLYMNGNIYEGLFWCSNTWWGANLGNTHSLNQWTYLGYYISFDDRGSVTPMVGYILNTDPVNGLATHDIALGAYYTYKKFDYYLWIDKLAIGTPRIVLGIDFTFNCD